MSDLYRFPFQTKLSPFVAIIRKAVLSVGERFVTRVRRREKNPVIIPPYAAIRERYSSCLSCKMV